MNRSTLLFGAATLFVTCLFNENESMLSAALVLMWIGLAVDNK